MSEADINEAKRSIRARFLVRRDQFTLDVDLRLPGQGVTAIFGPSGCGKTTLLRAIAGLDRWEGGEVSVGSSIWQDGSTFIPVHRRPIGYVFQEPRLFAHLTVRGNINYARQRARARAGSISTDGIVEMLDISPLLDRQPAALSGGEKQRVAIARALATNPRLLLMDEPLASLDRKRKREILPVLETLHRELDFPVFYVTHALDEVVRLADHVLLLQAGGTAGFGPVGDMLTRLDSSLAHGEDAGAMIEALVREFDREFGLAVLEFDGGQFLIPGIPAAGGTSLTFEPSKDKVTSLASGTAFEPGAPLSSGVSWAPGTPVRLSVAARDVSLALSRSTDSSILNVFPATVKEMTPEGDAQMMVRLLVGGSPLLARVTRKSANALRLAPGLPVFAQVKSVAMQG